MFYSNETLLGFLRYRERKLMIDEIGNFNLLRKVRRKIRKLEG